MGDITHLLDRTVQVWRALPGDEDGYGNPATSMGLSSSTPARIVAKSMTEDRDGRVVQIRSAVGYFADTADLTVVDEIHDGDDVWRITGLHRLLDLDGTLHHQVASLELLP